jgi:hypothetical protein
MSDEVSGLSVERMFPFVLRARKLIIGRDALRGSKSRLHFVLVAEDIGAPALKEVLEDYVHYPVVQHYASADFEKFFGVKGAKTLGFEKSGLAQSIYAELKQFRINKKPAP